MPSIRSGWTAALILVLLLGAGCGAFEQPTTFRDPDRASLVSVLNGWDIALPCGIADRTGLRYTGTIGHDHTSLDLSFDITRECVPELVKYLPGREIHISSGDDPATLPPVDTLGPDDVAVDPSAVYRWYAHDRRSADSLSFGDDTEYTSVLLVLNTAASPWSAYLSLYGRVEPSHRTPADPGVRPPDTRTFDIQARMSQIKAAAITAQAMAGLGVTAQSVDAFQGQPPSDLCGVTPPESDIHHVAFQRRWSQPGLDVDNVVHGYSTSAASDWITLTRTYAAQCRSWNGDDDRDGGGHIVRYDLGDEVPIGAPPGMDSSYGICVRRTFSNRDLPDSVCIGYLGRGRLLSVVRVRSAVSMDDARAALVRIVPIAAEAMQAV